MGGPAQIRQRLEDAAGKYRQHQGQEYRVHNQEKCKPLRAACVGGDDFLPLRAALYHTIVEQVS